MGTMVYMHMHMCMWKLHIADVFDGHCVVYIVHITHSSIPHTLLDLLWSRLWAAAELLCWNKSHLLQSGSCPHLPHSCEYHGNSHVTNYSNHRTNLLSSLWLVYVSVSTLSDSKPKHCYANDQKNAFNQNISTMWCNCLPCITYRG